MHMHAHTYTYTHIRMHTHLYSHTEIIHLYQPLKVFVHLLHFFSMPLYKEINASRHIV